MAATEVGRYLRRKRGGWAVWTDVSQWKEEWWPVVERSLVEPGKIVRESRHARTSMLSLSDNGGSRVVFLKVYHRAGWRTDFKDLWRQSRALRALRISLLLQRNGFLVPPVVAVGERRSRRLLRRAFLLTAAVEWPTLVQLGDRLASDRGDGNRQRRRAIVEALGTEVGRFHQAGYVHGDLVAPNILVDEGPPVRFCFLDHDRSRKRRHPSARLQRQDLVELNRLAVPVVRHTDRFRFLLCYAGARGWSRAELRDQARVVARKTKALIASRSAPGAVQ